MQQKLHDLNIYGSPINRLYKEGTNMPKKYEDGLTPQRRYQNKVIWRYGIQFNKNTESELIDHLQRQPNKQGYIKGLIRQDMEGRKEKK